MDRSVKLFFQGSAHSDFMYITGKAEIVNDRNKIEELWEPIMKTWFTEGKDDPRISVIKFIPEDGYYWDTKHGKGIAFLKMHCRRRHRQNHGWFYWRKVENVSIPTLILKNAHQNMILWAFFMFYATYWTLNATLKVYSPFL